MIGVTIGIGERYKFFAEKSAEAFIKHTGLEVKIIDVEILNSIDTSHIEHFDQKCWYLKLHMFDLFPEAENIIYFDCDWLAVNPFNPQQFANKKAIQVVRDRHFQENVIEASQKINKNPLKYFNAGFYIVNRTYHKRLFDLAKIAYPHLTQTWGDQCIMNQIFDSEAVKVEYLDKRFNFMDYHIGNWVKEIGIYGIHTSLTYEIYEGKTELDIETNKKEYWLNIGKCGKYILDDTYELELLPDGFTTKNLFWITDKENSIYLYDQNGERYEYNSLIRLK